MQLIFDSVQWRRLPAEDVALRLLRADDGRQWSQRGEPASTVANGRLCVGRTSRQRPRGKSIVVGDDGCRKSGECYADTIESAVEAQAVVAPGHCPGPLDCLRRRCLAPIVRSRLS